MSNLRSKPRRILVAVVFPLVGVGFILLYRLGLPWLDFYQNHLVIYECEFRSETIPVGVQHPGRIAEIHVETGQFVRRGDPIVRLDSTSLKAELEKQKAELNLTKAKYAAEKLAIANALKRVEAKQNHHLAKMQSAALRTKSVQVELGWLEKATKRHRKLVRKGSMSTNELEGMERELAAFRAKKEFANQEETVTGLELDILRTSFEDIKSRSAQLVVLQKEIEIAQASLELLQVRCNSATIRSQVDGTVNQIFRGAGSSVRVGEPIVQIQLQPIWCEIQVDESQIELVSPGSDVSISAKAFPNREIVGQVDRWMPPQSQPSPVQQSTNPVLQSDAKIRVLVHVEPSDLPLVPGMTGTAVFRKGDLGSENNTVGLKH